jgi:plasmid stabilization system protein ParE
MSYAIEFLVRARKELLDAWDWYEDKQPGLGDRFINETEKAVQQIQQTPDQFPERKKKFREARIKIFPYLIIYQIHKQKRITAIASVFHTSRNPKRKYTKLKKD